MPKARELAVAFGPFLSHERLKELTDGLPQQEAWRLVAAFTQRIVENLRDGVATRARRRRRARAAWDGKRSWARVRRRARGVPARAAVLRSVP